MSNAPRVSTDTPRRGICHVRGLFFFALLAVPGLLASGCRRSSSDEDSSTDVMDEDTASDLMEDLDASPDEVEDVVDVMDDEAVTDVELDGTDASDLTDAVLDSMDAHGDGMDAFDVVDDEMGGDVTDGLDAGDGSGVEASPPADILQLGTGDGLLLRGVVLTPTGVLDPGDVLIEGNTITCVAADCTTETGASDVTWIDTHSVISPGLVDAHNHVAYNFLPEWVPTPPGTLFQNRYEWAELPEYEEFIEPYAAHRSTGTHYCPAAKWGELRSLVHGTTTIQGQSFNQGCVDWAVRNADHHHNLAYDHMRTTIASVRDINDADADNLIASFDETVDPTTRFAVHMAEGYAGNHVDEEFDSFAGRDPRTNRHAGLSLLHNGTALLIHCVPLTEAQLVEAYETDSKIAWSPTSNMVLYGTTAPIQRILQLGIVTAIAPDWTISGSDEMLSEMRYGLQYGIDNAIPELTTEQIWKMSTSDAAIVVGLQDWIGRIEVGATADIAVFGVMGADPYEAVIESRAADVRLVLIGGEGWYGDVALQDATARNDLCEDFPACGTDKYICVQAPEVSSRGDETLSDIETQLYNILEGVGYPPEEQYGRGDELLPLVDCSL